MWLPETAVDLESLDLLAEAGITFTILAPHQAKAVRPHRRKRLARCHRREDRSQTRLSCLQAPIGQSMRSSFTTGRFRRPSPLKSCWTTARNSPPAARRFLRCAHWPQLMHIATDGETYGHHHRHGEMALAYALDYIETKKLAKITNYGEFLENYPPTHEVQIYREHILELRAWH